MSKNNNVKRALKSKNAEALANALDIATAQVQAQVTEAPAKKKLAPATAQKTGAKLVLHDDGARDCLKGALSSRTHAIHAVLVELYNEKGADATMSTSAITNAVNARWARALQSEAPTSNNSTASHLNTMKKQRAFARHGADGRGWRLDEAAIKLCAAR